MHYFSKVILSTRSSAASAIWGPGTALSAASAYLLQPKMSHTGGVSMIIADAAVQ
jgi:hypothetical protein